MLRRRLPLACLAPVLALGASLTAAQSPASAWLDRTDIANWNRRGAAVPRLPEAVGADELVRCRVTPAARSAEERLVAAAGWVVFRPPQPGSGVTAARDFAVWAAGGFDGMCRPDSYQGFVFVKGRFAGTVAPRPMGARSDGAARLPPEIDKGEVTIDFQRYGRGDPLCCPSRLSKVAYRIVTTPQGPLLVPSARGTRAAPQ